MPNYQDLRPTAHYEERDFALVFPKLEDEEKDWIIQNILNLRKGLDEQIPRKNADKTLLLASWNIKELGHLTNRLPESYFYIAEIINRFDIVAIQEIKSSLKGLDIIMRLLGDNWKYIITDITEGNDGNRERFAYIYDQRKVQSSGLSGEMVLWDALTANSEVKQLKRTPAITGFIAGWKEFSIINIHLQPGDDSDDQEIRKQEVELLLAAIKEKDKRNHFWNDNLMIIGDTNLYRNDDEIVQLFTDAGFREPNGLEGLMTNVSNNEIYDRIFLRVDEFFQLEESEGVERGGVFQMFDYVFTQDVISEYHDEMKEHKDNPSTLTTDAKFKTYFNRYWKRNQMSDHNPVWTEIRIDDSDKFLGFISEEFR